MSERILVPLDGSPLGESALRYVEELVSRLGPGKKTSVLLLHVVATLYHVIEVPEANREVAVPYTDEELAKIRKDSIEYLERVGAALREKGVEVQVQVKVESDAALAIMKAEEEFAADLVAMSTHGRSGIRRWAMGSVTDKVLRSGSVPVLMVRAS